MSEWMSIAFAKIGGFWSFNETWSVYLIAKGSLSYRIGRVQYADRWLVRSHFICL